MLLIFFPSGDWSDIEPPPERGIEGCDAGDSAAGVPDAEVAAEPLTGELSEREERGAVCDGCGIRPDASAGVSGTGASASVLFWGEE